MSGTPRVPRGRARIRFRAPGAPSGGTPTASAHMAPPTTTGGGERVSRADPGPWWRRPASTVVAVAGLATIAFAASLVVGRTLFPFGSGDLDEGVYVYQANMLLHGLVTLPAATYGEFFRPWLSGQIDGRIFTEFQIGLPALLAGFQAGTGSGRAGLAVVAAADVVALYGFAHECTGRRRAALLAALLFVLSPVVLVQSALVLTYMTSLLGLTASGWAFLRGTRIDRPALCLVGGLLLGVAVLTRPFDVVLFAGPVLVLCLWRWRRRGWRATGLGLVVPVVLGLAPSLVVTAWYNWQTTGVPWRFPITAADRLNQFGFGRRQIMVGQPDVTYSVHDALTALWTNLAAVPSWLAGGALLLVLAVVGSVVLGRRAGRRGEAVLLVAVAVAFPVGYFFQWATLLSASFVTNGIGPQYYLPSFASLVVLGAVGLLAVVTGRPWPVAVVVVAVLVATTGWAVPDKVRANAAITDSYRRVAAAIPTGLHRAVVFVPSSTGPFVPTPYPFLQPDPGLAAPVLYAADRGGADTRLMASMPGRRSYVLRTEYLPTDALLHPSNVLLPVRTATGPSLVLSVSVGRVPAHGDAVATFDGGGVHLTLPITPGSGPVTWVVTDGPSAATGASATGQSATGQSATGQSATGHVISVAGGSHGELAVGIRVGGTGASGGTRYEERVPFVASDGRLAAVVPGMGWERVTFPNGTRWLPADVARDITVRATAAGG